jgi:hypothetical protein
MGAPDKTAIAALTGRRLNFPIFTSPSCAGLFKIAQFWGKLDESGGVTLRRG